jgi:hypothetical protein
VPGFTNIFKNWKGLEAWLKWSRTYLESTRPSSNSSTVKSKAQYCQKHIPTYMYISHTICTIHIKIGKVFARFSGTHL